MICYIPLPNGLSVVSASGVTARGIWEGEKGLREGGGGGEYRCREGEQYNTKLFHLT